MAQAVPELALHPTCMPDLTGFPLGLLRAPVKPTSPLPSTRPATLLNSDVMGSPRGSSDLFPPFSFAELPPILPATRRRPGWPPMRSRPPSWPNGVRGRLSTVRRWWRASSGLFFLPFVSSTSYQLPQASSESCNSLGTPRPSPWPLEFPVAGNEIH